MNTKENKSRNTVAVAVAGGLILILILVLGTLWMGQTARRDTEAAVRSVSLLYLDELAGRREQVVAENLQDRISDMRTALELMTDDDGSIIIMDDKDLTMFVNLLNEDYYISPVNGKRYEIKSKKLLGEPDGEPPRG
jgi:hypothetical protein